jgi:hypothetical protein
MNYVRKLSFSHSTKSRDALAQLHSPPLLRDKTTVFTTNTNPLALSETRVMIYKKD